ncbi:ribosomal protein S6 modification protein [Chelonobacter oris]|uniref:Probable alpha-L-glutamate ligase n=1 Tax=Chelonobacter oris TaxID=505317 RepID=A0A0A3AMX6_9PAST|nr:RimK family alpha-L-glutamate ligase [Chelonobacter oris]KGQ70748.1 ribosomal protein S6 modification protein [Chelonobacter oris]
MKLLMLCREPRLYSCRRLLEAAETCGHTLDILDPNRCLLKLDQEQTRQFKIYYQPRFDQTPYLLPHYDAVIPRFGSGSTAMGCALLRHFEAMAIPCLNGSQAFLNARDKWHSLMLLQQHGLAVPPSALCGNEFDANYAVNQVASPTILKTLSGSQGIGVMLAEKRQSAVSILETLKQANIASLLQDFIHEANGSDIRCFVIGDNIVAGMQRSGQNGEFRANAHRGGRAETVRLSRQEKTLALNAVRTMGLDIAGVDIIRSNHGPLILEVNASPGLELIEKTSKIDIALQMLIYLEKQIQQQHTETQMRNTA